MERTLHEMMTIEGINKEFSAEEYIYTLFLDIVTNFAFGQGYNMKYCDFFKIIYLESSIWFSSTNSEFKKVKSVIADSSKEVGSRLLLWEFSPLIRLLDYNLVKKHRKGIISFLDTMKAQFKGHYEDYEESKERDICDSVIKSKNKLIKKDKNLSQFLNDDNLAIGMAELLMGGVETVASSFNWALLFMLYYPDIQEKLKQEIENEIGERLPKHEDKSNCHYLTAFITETLRIRNVGPVGVPHRTMTNSKIGRVFLKYIF